MPLLGPSVLTLLWLCLCLSLFLPSLPLRTEVLFVQLLGSNALKGILTASASSHLLEHSWWAGLLGKTASYVMSSWLLVDPLPTPMVATAKVEEPNHAVSATAEEECPPGSGFPGWGALPSWLRVWAMCGWSLVSSVQIETLWVVSDRNPTWTNLCKREVSLLIKPQNKLWSYWPRMPGFGNIKTIKCLSVCVLSHCPSFSFCDSIIPEKEVLSLQHYSSWISGKDSDWLDLGHRSSLKQSLRPRRGGMGYMTSPDSQVTTTWVRVSG